MRAALVLLLAAVASPVGAAPSERAPIASAAGEWLRSSEAGALPGAFAASDPRAEWERDDWDWVDRAGEPEPGDGSKSLLRAVLSSALLPGLGERYVGRPRRANAFHAAEAALWVTFAGYRIQGDLRRDRYEEFAQVQAGAPGKRDSDYYEHIGLWISLEEWHDIVRRDARLRFPDDPAAQQRFFDENQRYSEGDAWSWPDDETRVRYRQLRSLSERSYRNGRLAVGAAIVNRLASMVDALALARAHNRALREEARLELRFEPHSGVNGLVIGPSLRARY